VPPVTGPPKRTDKPWGHELLFALTPHYLGKILHLAPGGVLSLQYHENKVETIFVIKGEVTVETREADRASSVRLAEGEGFHVPAGLVHRFSSAGGCDLVEVSTAHPDDVVRLEDRYGRIP
jgi:mannose-6-phosphate isomerase-like protein (cupin superfamily)